jgi:diguanylate cyclase (GGDEF)-like protein
MPLSSSTVPFDFPPPASQAGRRWLWLLTLVVGALSSLAAVAAWHEASTISADKARAVFEMRTTAIARGLSERIDEYAQVLRGARGLVTASPGVIGRDWHVYVRELHISATSLGFESFGLVRALRPEAIPAFIIECRRDPASPDYVARIEPGADLYALLTLVEPDNARTAGNLGIDVMADPSRRAALERSRDTDQPAISSRVGLLSESTLSRTNVVLYLPIYRSDLPTATIEDRRRAIWGWVGSSLSVERMVSGVLAEMERSASSDLLHGIAFNIRDVTNPAEPQMLFSAHVSPGGSSAKYFNRQVPIDLAGRVWSIDFVSLPTLLGADDDPRPAQAALIGGLIAMLLTGLTFTLGTLWLSRSGLHRTNVALRQREEELHRLAVSDPLTGLANRRQFHEVGAAEWSRARRHGRPLALLMMDVDHFKAINDTYGHAVGDETLKLLVATGRMALRDCDLFARIGGEEFAVILPETDAVAALAVAERLRLATAQMVVQSGRGAFSVTISIGLAFQTSGDASLADLVKRADEALYAAKHGGRNRVVVSEPQQALPVAAS